MNSIASHPQGHWTCKDVATFFTVWGIEVFQCYQFSTSTLHLAHLFQIQEVIIRSYST